MKDEIDIGKDGGNLVTAMRKLAKDLFAGDYASASCVCIGVKIHNPGGSRNQQCVHAMSGDKGRKILRSSLVDDKVVPATTTADDVEGLLKIMANNLVVYQSATKGKAVAKQEQWVTHNCAESNLALYILKSGSGQLRDYTIASYQLKGETVEYKPLCHNCAQWCQNQFKVSADYKSHCE